ncbi:hypothetical protein GCM10008957_35240 [Deinococcus ruber]|uniref:Uncharacterized protein n=1 Tax=Deinococcus ruber TaxID=1848197 RepID=A0A918CG57_9DEIO|nr:hypothetical protein GCM10008957_35240 [Deinococcus ruber]
MTQRTAGCERPWPQSVGQRIYKGWAVNAQECLRCKWRLKVVSCPRNRAQASSAGTVRQTEPSVLIPAYRGDVLLSWPTSRYLSPTYAATKNVEGSQVHLEAMQRCGVPMTTLDQFIQQHREKFVIG